MKAFDIQLFGPANIQLSALPVPLQLASGSDDARVLTGFMSERDFNIFRTTHNPGMARVDVPELEAAYHSSVAERWDLPEVDLAHGILGSFDDSRVSAIATQPVFVGAFGSKSYEFAWIDPRVVVAQQGWVKTAAYASTDPTEFGYAFPAPAQPDFDVSVGTIPGIFYLISDDPAADLGIPNAMVGPGAVTISLATHINYIQVVEFDDVLYARNGTHRLAQAIRNGASRIPALVVHATTASQIPIDRGVGVFDHRVLLRSRRPPLIRDFATDAAVSLEMRRRKHGRAVRVMATAPRKMR